MKALMTFTLFSGKMYVNSQPQSAAFSGAACQQDEPVDWREDLQIYAASNGWDLKETDLESVANMVDFMIAHSPAFSDCVRRDDVHLPGGVVLLDSKVGGEQSPIILLWEEDVEPTD